MLHFQKSYISVREKNPNVKFSKKLHFREKKTNKSYINFQKSYISVRKKVLHFHKKNSFKKNGITFSNSNMKKEIINKH